MRLFDLHCDTLTRCVALGEEPEHASGHVALAHASAFARWAQVFAVFVPDDAPDPVAQCDATLAWFAARQPRFAAVCRPLLSVENGRALGGQLDRVDWLAAQGVRLLTLTWNGENELGFGAHCPPTLGLTPFGCAVLQRMATCGLLPDVSHLNRAGFWDVLRLHSGPLLATHSACAAVCPHPRNLDDDQLRALFARGGLVGLPFYPAFLGGSGDAHAFAAHVAHCVALGGANHIALGSDFDGCDLPPSIDSLGKVQGYLQQTGLAPALLEALCWRNAARFFA